MAGTQSPLGVVSIVKGYRKRTHSRPSGSACCFVFGYRLGTGVHPRGPPPHPSPAVHSLGDTALHWAAIYGNRRVVRSLVAFNADVNAISAAANRRSAPAESPPPSAVQEHAAALCRAARRNRRRRGAARAWRRRGRPERRRVPLRCAAQPNRIRNGRGRAGARRSDGRNGVGSWRSTRRGRGRCMPLTATFPPKSAADGWVRCL
jgi:hypothetical protein